MLEEIPVYLTKSIDTRDPSARGTLISLSAINTPEFEITLASFVSCFVSIIAESEIPHGIIPHRIPHPGPWSTQSQYPRVRSQ
jgi:hypothetical protein